MSKPEEQLQPEESAKSAEEQLRERPRVTPAIQPGETQAPQALPVTALLVVAAGTQFSIRYCDIPLGQLQQILAAITKLVGADMAAAAAKQEALAAKSEPEPPAEDAAEPAEN